MKTMLLMLLAPLALALPLTPENLEGRWCLATVEEQGLLIERNEQWEFEPDGVVVVESQPPERLEGAYTINGDKLETSLALQLTVVGFEEDAMLARSGDVSYGFVRGDCFED